MDKKELILTVAKDIMIAYKILPESEVRTDREKTINALGNLFSLMVKQVERVYNEIED